ncbi:T9SS type A sorting domain-containing protein [Winogradskyella thalassocola]|uniref:Por secretion system C-terminal sorting domain-containing protein n=1 Tax=Winogradskyella thalassocola TaxID=262004 RepID=A0A1G7ZA33_9FLAO|nr:T9SS type A sorting domain-containing protein [Winogradskyella thalassocola]SDH05554.1 Por secretion system C-terminal sorting domain-containing protein [Winogradskyella thalassocola]
MCASANKDITIQSPPLNDGNWHNIIVTYEKILINGNDQYIGNMYIDGTLSGSDATDELSTSWQTFLYSGNRTLEISGNQQFGFQGFLDDIRIFDRTLTPAEVTALSNYSEPAPLSRVYVDVNAIGLNNGSSWANAYTNLKTALANNTNTPDFWVTGGIYIPGSLRTDSFSLFENQKIYGGFNGTETDISQRNITANPTILSGDVNGNDANTFNATDPNRSENSYRIIDINGDNVVIDGFEITSANANSSVESEKEGSGISVNGAYTVNIENCQFTKHTLSRAGIVRCIDNSGNVNLNIQNTIFKDNQSVFATCYYGRSNNGTINLNLEGTLFTNNTATTNSGASLLWLRQDLSGTQNLQVINSTFTNNTLTSGTPVITYLTNVPSVEIYNSIFWNNTNSSGAIVDALQTGTTGSLSNNISNNGFSGYSSALNIITTDPLFADSASGDYTLQSGSPAIDYGDNSFITSTIDLNGNARIFNTTIDLGAYEYDASLGLDDVLILENQIKLYPNPTTSALNIESDSAIKSARVYSVLGKEVLNVKTKTIDVSSLSEGIYLIKIIDVKGVQHVKRFIKE